MQAQTAPSPPAASVRAKRPVFYGWWIVATGFLANFAYAEQFNSTYGVFVHAVGSEMGWGRTAMAGVQTVGRIPEAIMATLLGPVVDRHGARWIMGFGGLVVGASFMALVTIEELWELYLFKGFVMSMGAVCLGAFISVTVSNWFVGKRGRAMAFMNMGSSLATAVMPLVAAFMVENWGWRQAWFAMGVVVWALTVPAVIVFRRRPEDMGLQPDGEEPGASPGGPTSERERRRRAELLAADVVWTRAQVLRTPVFWIIVFSWGLASLAVTATNLHIIPFMQDLGYPLAIAAGGISLRATTALIGGPIWGVLVDRLPITAAASAQFGCKALAMLLFLLTPTAEGLALGLVLYGAGNAGAMVVQETIWANYYGRISLGLVRGLVLPMIIGLAALGPVAMGLLHDLSGSYQSSWLVLFCGFVAAAALIQLSRPPRYPGPRPAPQEP